MLNSSEFLISISMVAISQGNPWTVVPTFVEQAASINTGLQLTVIVVRCVNVLCHLRVGWN